MHDRRDLAIASLILAFVLLQLVQCSTSTPRPSPQPPSVPAKDAAVRQPHTEPDNDALEKEKGDESQEEERAKIHGVAHALQTIAANPEMRKTYGFKP